VPEIQILHILLKPQQKADSNLLKLIDNAIPYPIIFELEQTNGQRQTVAAYKRPSDAAKGQWVVDSYHQSVWQAADSPRQALPAATNLQQLYQQLLGGLIPLAPRSGENLQQRSQRQTDISKINRQIQQLAGCLQAEKQFNRQIELNQQLRQLKQQAAQLQQSP
jgi:hypothetical protein